MKRISERTTLPMVVSFYDSDAVLTVPTSIRYRIDDEASDSTVVDWTSVTPASSVTITVTATQNQLVSRNNALERRTVTVQADHGLTSEWSGEVQFEIARGNGVLN